MHKKKSTAEIEAEYKKYCEVCHDVDKHKVDTLKLFERFAKLAREDFDKRAANLPESGINLWTELYNYRKGSGSGVTGKLLRQNLRKFIEAGQGGQCCYCRRPLVNISNAKPIEHILPRKPFIQHTFNFWNLAVACFDCNHAKKNFYWVSDELITNPDYPKPDDFCDSYHPRYHTYDEHVRFVRVQTNTINISLYIGNTDIGKSLCRHLLKKISGKDILLCSNLALKESVTKLLDDIPGLSDKAAAAVGDFNDALSDVVLKLIDER